jgi:hypothetical protein
MEEGMPLHPHRKEIVEFSEIYQFSTMFSTTPDKIIEWKNKDPYLFKCFKIFMGGMSKANNEKGKNGTNNNRYNSKFKKTAR